MELYEYFSMYRDLIFPLFRYKLPKKNQKTNKEKKPPMSVANVLLLKHGNNIFVNIFVNM